MFPLRAIFVALLAQTVLGYTLMMPDYYLAAETANYACLGAITETATVCDVVDYSMLMACVCGEDSGFGSMADCLVRGYDNLSVVIAGFIDQCKTLGNITMLEEDFYANYTRTQKLLRNVSDIADFNVSKKVDFPVLLDYTELVPAYKSGYLLYLRGYNFGIQYGIGLLGYWAGVLLTAAVVNWTIRLFPAITGLFTGRVSSLYRRYITLCATIHRKKAHHQPLGFFDLLVPSRMESLVVTGFLVLTVALSLVRIEPAKPYSAIFPVHSQEITRYVADRTGILVSFVVPLLVLFAGRNNFLQWLTRWNFATFITYHRWVSRIAIILVFIHSVCFTIGDIAAKEYHLRMVEPYMIWGTMACVAGGLIFLQGMMYFRRRSYEIFLLIHIVLALLFIVGAWHHTDVLGYSVFYWATVGVWAFDRAVRFCRLAVFGAPKASVSLMADETLRVVVPKPKHWKSIPGGHAFLHFVMPLCFWQSHPFTFTDSVEKDSIVLYVKVKGGVTHGVYKRLYNSPGKTAQIRVCVEGPYGEPSSAIAYKNAVFLAGGNGIPGIYSECVDLAKRQNDRQSLKLVWVVREWKSLSWFFSELKRLEELKIDTTIYVTRPELASGLEHFGGLLGTEELEVESNEEKNQSEEKSKNSDIKDEVRELDTEEKFKEMDSSSGEKTSPSAIVATIKTTLKHITFIEGRPSIEQYVGQEIDETNGSVAFVTCGHPLMVDDVRYAVIDNLDKTKYRVEFFEQLQVWA